MEPAVFLSSVLIVSAVRTPPLLMTVPLPRVVPAGKPVILDSDTGFTALPPADTPTGPAVVSVSWDLIKAALFLLTSGAVMDKLAEALKGADMIFIAAGMGGGTGTGAAPIIAEVARELGALTVGVVTKPFSREGRQRLTKGEEGIRELKKHVDSLIVIPNDRLLGLAGKSMSILDAFKPSDDVLRQAVQGISDLITTSGLINVDFADVKAIMSERGMAMMGIGMGSGENRAVDAATRAISSPLLEDIDISGAKGVLVNISGSSAMTMDEFDAASRIIHEKVHEDANIIVGLVIDEELGDVIKVTAIATGFGDRFDMEKSRQEMKNVAPLINRSEVNREIPTFIREKQQRETIARQRSFLMDDEDQYDIPTFLRKSVD